MDRRGWKFESASLQDEEVVVEDGAEQATPPQQPGNGPAPAMAVLGARTGLMDASGQVQSEVRHLPLDGVFWSAVLVKKLSNTSRHSSVLEALRTQTADVLTCLTLTLSLLAGDVLLWQADSDCNWWMTLNCRRNQNRAAEIPCTL